MGLEHPYRNGLTCGVGPELQYRKGRTLCETGASVCSVSCNNPSHRKANSLTADYKKRGQEQDPSHTHGPPATHRQKVRTSDTPDTNANPASHTDTHQAPVPSPALITGPTSPLSPTNTKDAGTCHLSYPPVPLHIPQTLPWKQTTALEGTAVGMPNIPSQPRQVEASISLRQHNPFQTPKPCNVTHLANPPGPLHIAPTLPRRKATALGGTAEGMPNLLKSSTPHVH